MAFVQKRGESSTGSDTKDKPERFENLYARDMSRAIDAFKSQSATPQETIEAIKQIGYTAYIGGDTTLKLQKKVLPNLIAMVKDRSCPAVIKSPVISTLSLMAHRNRPIQNNLCTDRELLEDLLNTIADVEHLPSCLLSCYLFLVIVTDNAYAIKKVKDVSKVREKLTIIAGMNLPWSVWGRNLADTLLTLLGFKALDAGNVEHGQQNKDDFIMLTLDAGV